MFKRMIILILIISISIIAGCSGGGGDDGSSSDKPWLSVEVFPNDNDSSYRAWGFLEIGGGKSYDAHMTLNGIQITPDSSNGSNVSIDGIGSGDEVKLHVNHPKIATIEEVLTVPQTVTDISTTSTVAQWKNERELVIEFSNGDATYYVVYANGIGIGHPAWNASPIKIGAEDSNSFLYNNPAKITIQIRGVKLKEFPHFSSASRFQVLGLKSEEYELGL